MRLPIFKYALWYFILLSVYLAGPPDNASKAETTVANKSSVAESAAVAPIKVASPAPAPAAGKDLVFKICGAAMCMYYLKSLAFACVLAYVFLQYRKSKPTAGGRSFVSLVFKTEDDIALLQLRN